MPPFKNTTWLEYLDELQQREFDPGLLHVEGVEKLLGIADQVHPFFRHIIPSIYLLDYTTGNYVVLSDNCIREMGYYKEDYQDGGLPFTISNFNPQDMRVFNEHIFPDRVKFLKGIPPEEHAQYVFSHNYRHRGKDGKYMTLLQRNAFIRSDKNGKPLMSLGMVLNVEHYKNPNTVVQLIEKVDANGPSSVGTVQLKKTYFVDEADSVLTKREKEILNLLSEGLSTKQIADRIFLSEHTVTVHRRNMMAKTNTANVAELLAWAIRKEII
jgi:DNA-binding CsgD family transcriptional regulator